MSKILAIDLGKFKSVTCLLETDTNATEFWTMATERYYLETVLKRYVPDLVVIEACAIAGWIHDICTSLGYRVLVCNPAQEPWKSRFRMVASQVPRSCSTISPLASSICAGEVVPQ